MLRHGRQKFMPTLKVERDTGGRHCSVSSRMLGGVANDFYAGAENFPIFPLPFHDTLQYFVAVHLGEKRCRVP